LLNNTSQCADCKAVMDSGCGNTQYSS